MATRTASASLKRPAAILLAIMAGALSLWAPATAIAWGPGIYYEIRYDNLSKAQADAVEIVAQYLEAYFGELQIDNLISDQGPVRIGIGIPVNVDDSYRAERLQMEIVAVLDHPRFCYADGCLIVILQRRMLTDEWHDVFVGVSSGNGLVRRSIPFSAWCIETKNATQYLDWFNSRLIVTELAPARSC